MTASSNVPDPELETVVRTEVLVLGAGISGLAQAIALRRAGIDFLILEKADDIGGTWRDNTYPGASCDVESHLYSYSTDRNPAWASTYAKQPEILSYLQDVTRRHQLRPSIRFGTDVREAEWDADTCTWTVTTATGLRYRSRVLVLGVGGLHRPQIPDLPGADTFTGASWHSSGWNHDVDLTGRHVTLIGVGASGVQIVPHIAAHAASVTVFQRSAPWVLPKADVPVPTRRQRLFAALPWVQTLYRLRIYLRREKRGIGFHHRPDALRVAEPVVLRAIDAQITDPALRDLVTPDYRFGCKRVLFSNDYYRTLDLPHVRVVPGTPGEIRGNVVVDRDGYEHPSDVIIYATGFDLRGSFDRIRIRGTDGRLLTDAWRAGMRTYNGIAVVGFPNLFVLLGPNGAVAYTSIITNAEAQARYVVRAVRALRARRVGALSVTPQAEQQFLEQVGARFRATVWHRGGCQSWYISSSPPGTVLWPNSTLSYRWLLRRVRRKDFTFT